MQEQPWTKELDPARWAPWCWCAHEIDKKSYAQLPVKDIANPMDWGATSVLLHSSAQRLLFRAPLHPWHQSRLCLHSHCSTAFWIMLIFKLCIELVKYSCPCYSAWKYLGNKLHEKDFKLIIYCNYFCHKAVSSAHLSFVVIFVNLCIDIVVPLHVP